MPGLAFCLSCLLALPGLVHASPWQYFEVEGVHPLRADGALHFSALQSRYLSANAHGWRNELKIGKPWRRSLHETAEALTAEVEVRLPVGAKSIILQYHEAGLGVVASLLVADIQGRQYLNNQSADGVFDVFLRARAQDGKERTYPLRTLRHGQRLQLNMQLQQGVLRLGVDGREVVHALPDRATVYLKFGDYLQAQRPDNHQRVARQADFAAFYAAMGMHEGEVVFHHWQYRRLPLLDSTR